MKSPPYFLSDEDVREWVEYQNSVTLYRGLSRGDWWRIKAALELVATDPREPERYRRLYQETLDRVRGGSDAS